MPVLFNYPLFSNLKGCLAELRANLSKSILLTIFSNNLMTNLLLFSLILGLNFILTYIFSLYYTLLIALMVMLTNSILIIWNIWLMDFMICWQESSFSMRYTNMMNSYSVLSIVHLQQLEDMLSVKDYNSQVFFITGIFR